MTLTERDHAIATEHGSLFARSWVHATHRADSDSIILLFHDSLGSVELWRDFPRQLAMATGYSVVAYDRLGFGKSDVNPDRLALTFVHDEAVTMVPVVIAAMQREIGFASIIPFGHSVGGGMAVATAAVHPQWCRALVTESAQTFLEDRTAAGIRAAKAGFQQAGQLERLARYHGAKARWVLEAWTETWLASGFAEWSLDEDLRNVCCPMLALHGDQDEYGSPAHPERIARTVQSEVRTVLMQGFGHVPHRENPERVLDEINRFLITVR